MRATAILVRYEGGWQWVEMDSPPSIQIETCQGQSGDTREAITKAEAELATYSGGQTEYTAAIDMEAADLKPGEDWFAGDTLTVDGVDLVVQRITYAVDNDTGRINAVPQFGALLDSPVDRVDQTIRSIGALSKGTSKLARPVQGLPNPNLRPN